MLCMVCKEKEAKVHLTQIVGDKMQKVDLCEECAGKKGVDDPAGFSLADLMLGSGTAQETEPPSRAVEVRCPKCGFTQADFKKAGRLGCPDCYVAFAEGLDGLLKTMHRGTRHTGKVPQTHAQTRDIAEKLKLLQKKLEKAVHDENFEQAALMRDEIKLVREKLAELTS